MTYWNHNVVDTRPSRIASDPGIIELIPGNRSSLHKSNIESDAAFILAPRPEQDDDGHPAHPPRSPETSAWEAWIQLTKAYIGPGCLSLPWAVSQLGLPMGTVVVGVVAVWTSHNCWNVLSLKRVIMNERRRQLQQHVSVTYPDVGEWAYNRKFKDVLLVSICVQQMAVCTVFLSFIGENIAAVIARTLVQESEKPPSHALVISMALPFVMLLSCLPNLKVLSPVMVVATFSLFAGFGLLGVVIATGWAHRPQDTQSLYEIEWSQVPMAVCAILYSFEGICVVLPIESAMAQPEHFQTVFISSMTFTAVVFATVGALCVVAFGNVTNGSVTAFLVENLGDEEGVQWWLYMANTACSLAVLLTYPLQLFPCFELIGPWMTRVLRLDRTASGTQAFPTRIGHARSHDRSFSPLPLRNNPDDWVVGNHDYHDPTHTDINRAAREGGPPNNFDSEMIELELIAASNNKQGFMAAFTAPGDSALMRTILVAFTYVMAIAVPNVQLLVSLAGALSGSVTGLIMPPLLELAYLKRQEADVLNSVVATSGEAEEEEEDSNNKPVPAPWASRSPFNVPWKKWECYILLCSGVVVCVFGTGAVLVDIVRVYSEYLEQ